MFKPGEDNATRTAQVEAVSKNYVIQVNDYLKLEVFSNNGERLIDPNGELLKEGPDAQPASTTRAQPTYLVAVDGTAKFPMIEHITMVGLTIREAEVKLQEQYNKFYKECYVQLTFNNKRVIVLGSPGGQVIPLINENVSVVEVLALAKGIGNDGKSHNIRLIRGKEVFVLDLSTIEGLKTGNMIVQPGDVVYVEPVRRPFAEGARDLAPVLSLVISLATLVVVFVANQNNN
jgi:polysaccharide export outer membrane protein